MELFNGRVTEPEFSENAEYILVNNEDFYDIGFRVMKNQEKDGIIPCHRLKYNGQIKLVYFTEFFTPLRSYVKRCSEAQLGFILGRLWKALEAVQENGFINLGTIDLRLDRIFVEEKAQTVKLVYIPISSEEHITTADARASLEAKLVGELGRSLPTNNYMEQPAKAAATRINVNNANPQAPVMMTGSSQSLQGLQIVAVQGGLCFTINQPSFVIGKSPEKADGVITGNPAISRAHCRVESIANGYVICDLGSSNGTYLNGVRLAPNQMTSIKAGDRLKLANMDFLVK